VTQKNYEIHALNMPQRL